MLGQIEQRMLNLAFSGLQIGIGIYDKDGHMMTSNEEFNRLQNDYPQDCELLRRSIREGKSGKEQWTREDGTVLESFVVPFTNDQGETDGYIFRLSNITERRPRYGNEDQSRLEEIFLNNVNHEIRTARTWDRGCPRSSRRRRRRSDRGSEWCPSYRASRRGRPNAPKREAGS